MATKNEIVTMVESFTKSNPEMVRRLRKASREIITPDLTEMTAQELDDLRVVFCLGGVWATINQVNNPNQ